MEYYSKMASAIYNDIVSGLRGYSSNPTISIELLEDEIIETRLQVIKEYLIQGVVPWLELMLSIKCISLDCKDMARCPCGKDYGLTTAHFEVPLMILDCGVPYIGSVDMQNPFVVYTTPQMLKYHKYRRRGKDKPYVYIDTTPNPNGMLDCWVFNAPLLKTVSVQAVFKDPRQLEEYGCCDELDATNMSSIDIVVKNRLADKKIQYYRQLAIPLVSNDQTAR